MTDRGGGCLVIGNDGGGQEEVKKWRVVEVVGHSKDVVQ